jgi:hypothetical protein
MPVRKDPHRITSRLVQERDRSEESARTAQEEADHRRAESTRAEAKSFSSAFFELASLSSVLLRRHQSDAELVTIDHWKPRSKLIQRLFPLKSEDVAAWEIAHGWRGPYHPYHDMPIDTWDYCRVMVSPDGRVLFGAYKGANYGEETQKPRQYRVVSTLGPEMRLCLNACGLRKANDIQRRIAAIRNGKL